MLCDLKLNDMSSSAWWSALWIPNKTNKAQLASTSFLVYYQFKYSDNDDFFSKIYGKYKDIPIIGILPIKFDENIWLNIINKGKIIINFSISHDEL